MSLRSNGHGCGMWYMPKAAVIALVGSLLSFDNFLAIFFFANISFSLSYTSARLTGTPV